MRKLVLSLALNMAVGLLYAQNPGQTYQVLRINDPIIPDANWHKPVWQGIEALTLNYHMGDKPDHFPEVQAKIAYDDRNIYLIWQVKDRYVKAVASKHQDPVFQDSCVEFFFTPGASTEQGYFNLEMNCGGTMLFKQRSGTDQPFVEITNRDLKKIQVAHSMPRRVPQEITEEVTWYVEYALPFSMLANYYQLEAPEPGAIWRANLYKCADKSSHPHWLTWSPVDFPKPKFHLPQFFGKLVFE